MLLLIVLVSAGISLVYGLSGRVTIPKGNKELYEVSRSDKIKASLPMKDFKRQHYISSYLNHYGVSSIGASLDERKDSLYIVTLDFTCENNGKFICIK